MQICFGYLNEFIFHFAPLLLNNKTSIVTLKGTVSRDGFGDMLGQFEAQIGDAASF
jgi:hypothetical protein